MKRAIALLLAAAMVITILASCGTNEKQAYLNARKDCLRVGKGY